MIALLDVGLALLDGVGRDARAGEQLGQVGAGEVLHRTGVRDLMHAAAHEQIPGQRAGGGVVDSLVDPELPGTGAGLQEVVVRQV